MLNQKYQSKSNAQFANESRVPADTLTQTDEFHPEVIIDIIIIMFEIPATRYRAA